MATCRLRGGSCMTGPTRGAARLAFASVRRRHGPLPQDERTGAPARFSAIRCLDDEVHPIPAGAGHFWFAKNDGVQLRQG